MLSPRKKSISKNFLQLIIGSLSCFGLAFDCLKQYDFSNQKLLLALCEILRLSLKIELPELQQSGWKFDICDQRRFHRTSKKAYNYFYLTELNEFEVQPRKTKSLHLACKKHWLNNKSQRSKNGAEK